MFGTDLPKHAQPSTMVANPKVVVAGTLLASPLSDTVRHEAFPDDNTDGDTQDLVSSHNRDKMQQEMDKKVNVNLSVEEAMLEEEPTNEQQQHECHSLDSSESVTSSTGSDTFDVGKQSCDKEKGATATSFQPGDHVYVWCHAGVYQHHGIVLQVDHMKGTAVIADFTNLGVGEAEEKQKRKAGKAVQKKKKRHRLDSLGLASNSSDSEAASRSCSGLPGGFRMLQEDVSNRNDSDSLSKKKSKWCKVKYNANRFETTFWRPGTCSGATPDAPDVILARVHFLMMHFHLVPPYHLFECNCETVAVWCTTGEWRTRQVSHLLNWSKTTSVLGTGGAYFSAATTTTTCVSTSGLAGLLGTTTELTLLAANPLLLPAIYVTGAAVGGMALWNSLQTRHRWKLTSTLLNSEFQHFWAEPTSGVKMMRVDDDADDDDDSMTVDTATTAATTATSVDGDDTGEAHSDDMVHSVPV